LLIPVSPPSHFQVSVQNDPPTAPIPLLPLDGDTLYTATPTLQWLDSLDPEGASLTYQVEVYSDKHLTTLVASVSGLPGTLLTTTWQVTPALLEKTTYYWRVRGSDGALSSAWSGTQSFKIGKLTTRGTPRYFAAKPGGLNGRRVATIGSLGGLTGGETEAIFFYQTDHLGTPLMMTDQVGQVVWEAEYLPFGEPVSINEDVDGDGVKVTNNLRFPGQYEDGETGLHYNWARYYEPRIGRFTSVDPIQESKMVIASSTCGYKIPSSVMERSQDMEPYVYGVNNPITYDDPTGLSVIPFHCSASKAAVIQLAAEIAASTAESCLPCKDRQNFKDVMSNLVVNCETTNYSPTGRIACGWTKRDSIEDEIHITPLGFAGEAVGCGCLQSTILHEVTHRIGYNESQAKTAQRRCFSCSN
jgi:RHS repeat-associated protein